MATSTRKKAPARAGGTKKPRSRQQKPGKTIVILSDGTGNSASALFKTNVWRLYRALDLSETPKSGERRQIAYYDDGVGTSSFRPLALLGGAFGVGLKRNVLDLYRFICRNYEAGDTIYAFGSSRGAFTVRVAVGLLAMECILKCETEAELNRYSADAYRKLRKQFKQGRWLPVLPLGDDDEGAAQTSVVVQVFRWLRDKVIWAVRRASGHRLYDELGEECRKDLPAIDFVGVFDTVAAYGMPLAELTRGVDEWIWPLSMPDYKLSKKVRTARHALALDDERDTFHPLLWDEHEEERLVKEEDLAPGRIKQVWFSGMHSDVGGGYPDDATAHVPLMWMIGEAETAGLRFDAETVEKIRRAANVFAPMHNSRRGVGSYYRLQPRKISARLDPPDQTSLIMQDPRLGDLGMLKSVVVHESVFERIERGTDRAATITLPASYQVERYDGTTAKSAEPTKNAEARAKSQEWIWNKVWWRRVIYFTTVGVSILMALLPLLSARTVAYACDGPLCFVSAAIAAVGGFLPGFAERWILFYAAWPALFLLLVAVLAGLTLAGSIVHQHMRDDMRIIWEQSLGIGTDGSSQARKLSEDPTTHWVYRLRTNRHYQSVLRFLKWRLVPAVFGFLVVLLILNLLAALPVRAVSPDVCDAGSSGLRAVAMCWLTPP